jgi:hypothetical protein
MELVLSLYSGIGLFDSAFKSLDYCVVSAGDIFCGQHHNIAKFQGIGGHFDGIIVTSPCQEFSKANRNPNYDLGCAYISEAVRVIFECKPKWCIFENVEGSPDIHIQGYGAQRFFLNDAHCGGIQDRHRKFQWFEQNGHFRPLQFCRILDAKKPASCVTTRSSISISEMARLQGFPDLKLSGFTSEGAKRAIGNGVSFNTATTIARAIRFRNNSGLLCVCGCGESIDSNRTAFNASCRKRIERREKTPNKALFYCPRCSGDCEVDTGIYGIQPCDCVYKRSQVRNLITPNSVELKEF